MEKLLEVAERAELHYQLRRIDPTDTRKAPTKVDTGTRRSTAKPVRSLQGRRVVEASGGEDESTPEDHFIARRTRD